MNKLDFKLESIQTNDKHHIAKTIYTRTYLQKSFVKSFL